MTPSLETVKDELTNARANGYTFDDWTCDQIAADLISYSAACEDADPAELAAIVFEARKDLTTDTP